MRPTANRSRSCSRPCRDTNARWPSYTPSAIRPADASPRNGTRIGAHREVRRIGSRRRSSASATWLYRSGGTVTDRRQLRPSRRARRARLAQGLERAREHFSEAIRGANSSSRFSIAESRSSPRIITRSTAGRYAMSAWSPATPSPPTARRSLAEGASQAEEILRAAGHLHGHAVAVPSQGLARAPIFEVGARPWSIASRCQTGRPLV